MKLCRKKLNLGNWCDNERFHSCSGIVAVLFAEPRINHILDSINSKGGLSNICGQYNLEISFIYQINLLYIENTYISSTCT